jgi:hypothetical protein
MLTFVAGRSVAGAVAGLTGLIEQLILRRDQLDADNEKNHGQYVT